MARRSRALAQVLWLLDDLLEALTQPLVMGGLIALALLLLLRFAVAWPS